MDIGKSFTYAFEDENWLSKLGIGALISMVPILNFAWAGYALGIIRNVAERRLWPLPSWDDLGQLFMDGLMLWLARIIYGLPAVVLFFVPYIFMMLPAFSNDSDIQGILMGIGGLFFLLLMGLWFLYMLLLTFLLPAVQLNYARYKTFASCFQFQQIFGIVSSNFGAYLTAWAVTIGAYLVIYSVLGTVGGVLGVIPCIGWLLSIVLIPVGLLVSVWLGAISAHLFGQVLATV